MNALSSISPRSLSPGFPAGSINDRAQGNVKSGNTQPETHSPKQGGTKPAGDDPVAQRSAQSAQSLVPEELKQLTELKARDREVRAHEAAHQAVGGQYAGAMSLTYERGPDGAQYAVGGEVSIDIAPVEGNPQATIEKMRVVRAAAMAPAEPSGQDRAVAAQAMQAILQAQGELAAEKDRGADAPSKAQVEPDNFRVSRSGQQASNTYQSVSSMTAESGRSQPGFGSVSA
ncbi:hypothetical protein BKP64_02030 [Marinobacter salinus]|uniref:Catalase n=1 Tax=Marinobacter salinus TaxID=1874317 RepID=A0A1D9GHD4_9GAMM|nr:putative metalloprotease CJM1_0395 family protein [Marinobacter salinus]AOY87057.1 hypothetical protein BKP64_02030 [Marinobacter salinus]